MSTQSAAHPFSGLMQTRSRTFRMGVDVHVDRRALTEREQRVLGFMREFHAENDLLPPASVISNHFGWASPNAAHETLIALAKKGALDRNVLGKWRFARAEGGAQ